MCRTIIYIGGIQRGWTDVSPCRYVVIQFKFLPVACCCRVGRPLPIPTTPCSPLRPCPLSGPCPSVTGHLALLHRRQLILQLDLSVPHAVKFGHKL